MKKISFWAKDHVWTTRLLIIFFIYPLLNITGWLLGDLLQSMGIDLSQIWSYALSLGALYLLLIYPFKSTPTRNNHHYTRRKTIDVLLAGCTFLLIVTTGNHLDGSEQATGFPLTHASTFSKDLPRSAEKSKIKAQKKSLKQWVKQLRKKYREAGNGTKIALTILAVILAIFLIFGLAALACTIACSGSEAIAYILFLLGTAGIIFGLVKVINSIHRGPKKQVPEPEKPSS